MSNAMLFWVVVLVLSIVPNVRNKVLNEVELAGGGSPVVEQGRIIGGKMASEGQFPFAAALHLIGLFICTASIVSRYTILTAAHCVILGGIKVPVQLFSAIVGDVNRLAPEINITFIKVTVHPDYNNMTLANDIAFLTTDLPIAYSRDVQRICVAKPWKGINFYKFGTAMGWGQTTSAENGTSSEYLRYAELLVTNHEYCKSLYTEVTDKQMCADFLNKGICFGDSGGPFVKKNLFGKYYVQIGIASAVSTRVPCGSLFVGPGVFTRMSYYSDWLLSASNDRTICFA